MTSSDHYFQFLHAFHGHDSSMIVTGLPLDPTVAQKWPGELNLLLLGLQQHDKGPRSYQDYMEGLRLVTDRIKDIVHTLKAQAAPKALPDIPQHTDPNSHPSITSHKGQPTPLETYEHAPPDTPVYLQYISLERTEKIARELRQEEHTFQKLSKYQRDRNDDYVPQYVARLVGGQALLDHARELAEELITFYATLESDPATLTPDAHKFNQMREIWARFPRGAYLPSDQTAVAAARYIFDHREQVKLLALILAFLLQHNITQARASRTTKLSLRTNLAKILRASKQHAAFQSGHFTTIHVLANHQEQSGMEGTGSRAAAASVSHTLNSTLTPSAAPATASRLSTPPQNHTLPLPAASQPPVTTQPLAPNPPVTSQNPAPIPPPYQFQWQRAGLGYQAGQPTHPPGSGAPFYPFVPPNPSMPFFGHTYPLAPPTFPYLLPLHHPPA